MRVFHSALLAVFCFLLTACGSTSKSPSENRPVANELKSWDTANYEKKGLFGKVIVFATDDIGTEPVVSIYDHGVGSSPKSYTVGLLNPKEYYDVSLAKGTYNVSVRTSKTLFSDPILRIRKINIVGGETIYLQVLGKDLVIEKSLPNDLSLKGKGTPHLRADITRRFRASIAIAFNLSTPEDLKKFNVTVTGNVREPVFKINGQPVNYQTKSNNNYEILERLLQGDNEIKVEAVGLDGEVVIRKQIVHIKTDKEMELEVLAAKQAEREKAEQEKLKKLNEEIALRAKQAEEERIAREGDGSPDDLACKRYGLKPQTQGYAECRMRLDLMRQENAREQQKITQRQLAQDNARKAELQRRYEEIERQNAEISNRESKCRFVQSQEYLRPALGGFFESMSRANSAYDNCMAGVPQINTSCSKDGYGNINCTSR